MKNIFLIKGIMSVIWAIFLILFSSCETQKFSAHEVPMEAVIDTRNAIIMVTGAIGSNENIIQVIIPDVPSGEWTVIKSEVNLTHSPWRAWEIVFGDDTQAIKTDTLTSSRQFTKFTSVPERNALVFHEGEVVPGESVLKIFQINQKVRGPVLMSHNRTGGPVTADQIMNGFPQLPVVKFTLKTRRIE